MSKRKENNSKKRTKSELEIEEIRLNKFIANAGVCSRRDADKLIQEGKISVNGKVVKELGVKVKPTDKVAYKGKKLSKEKSVYFLLNKPKGYITSVSDPKERKTVMDLMNNTGEERVYPVGRLDRNTTGLLLLTNDGILTTKLLHPSGKVQKIYHIEVNKPLSQQDYEKIIHNKITLEDGEIEIDGFNILNEERTEFGIELHSGKNRVVRRIFESMGYEIIKLDRVVFAGLTKHKLPRGKWRVLTSMELLNLKKLAKIKIEEKTK